MLSLCIEYNYFENDIGDRQKFYTTSRITISVIIVYNHICGYNMISWHI